MRLFRLVLCVGGLFALLANRSSSFVSLSKIIDAEGIYEGEVVDGRYHGQGTYVWNSGFKYTGEFVLGQPEGKGVLELPNGGKFIGEISNLQINGYGVFLRSDGWKHEGMFSNNLLNGPGTSYDDKGVLVYKGEFKDGFRHGYGVLYEDGEVYEGEFVANVKHGQGKVRYTNGDSFEGLFEEGECESGLFLMKEHGKY